VETPTVEAAKPVQAAAPVAAVQATEPDAVIRMDGQAIVVHSQFQFAKVHQGFPRQFRTWDKGTQTWRYEVPAGDGNLTLALWAYAIRKNLAEAGAVSVRGDKSYAALVQQGRAYVESQGKA
jgi:hypothetical protein